MPIRPEFPAAVDSTMMAAFRSCPQKMFRMYLEHWKPKQESVHLVAGKAFAAGMEAARLAFYTGKGFTGPVEAFNREDAEAEGLAALIAAYGDFECPAESAKSLERMCGALAFYFSEYPLGGDGTEPIRLAGDKWGIEFSFAEPLPFHHPVTGDPVLYTGRADAIVHFAGGIYITDEKTATSLGTFWARQWEMRSQFTGYSWACRSINVRPSGTLIRGIGILKTRFDTQQVLTYRADWEIDRWLEQLLRDLDRMQRMWEEGYFDYSLDGACAEYGGCPFVRVCKSQDGERWLEADFRRRVWDPLLREERDLA